jgi:small subunit ribosomal protein S17
VRRRDQVNEAMTTQTTGGQTAGGQAAGVTGAPQRTRRATRVGVVTSAKRQKTIGVTVADMVRHAKYGKYIRRRAVLHAHDERGEAHLGDRVEIIECRPLSKTKNWRLVRIVKRAPQEAGPSRGARAAANPSAASAAATGREGVSREVGSNS